MKNFKWNQDGDDGTGGLYVCLFVSRNKDNKDLEGFHERRRSFLAYGNSKNLDAKFNEFVSEGVKGEISRFYMSVNERDPDKVRKQLIIELLQNDDVKIGYISSIAAGVAAKHECGMTRKWMIDFDSKDQSKLKELMADIGNKLDSIFNSKDSKLTLKRIDAELLIHPKPTINGYAVIVDNGFDTRGFSEKWGDIATIKKDDLLLVDWSANS